MQYITLATEDELSEAVGLRLISELGVEFTVNQFFRKNGSSYLKLRLNNFCQMANRVPVLLFTDLDNEICASALISRWMGQRARPDNFLFRVVVREIESWLLADHVAIKSFFGTPSLRLPEEPDILSDPKKTLLEIAKKAPRNIRNELIIEKGAVASQGLGYNSLLCEFVRSIWQPQRAALRSNSLMRTRIRINELMSN